MKMSSRPKNKCPYIHDKDCGRPDKLTCDICNSEYFCNCISYRSLKEVENDGSMPVRS